MPNKFYKFRKMAGYNSLAVPILEASNFNNWHFRIVTILKKEQCSEALNDPPLAGATTEERNKFFRLDTKAQSVIVQGVSDKHLDIIKDCKTAKEQLSSLKDVFVRTSAFTKLSLWRKLLGLKSGVNEKLEDHFLKFDTIIRELKDLGSNIDEGDRVCHLLLSLPSKFDTVVTALETVSDVKIDFVKARLLDEEIKLNSRNENGGQENEVSFKATTSKGCFICGDRNHFKSQCPKRNMGSNNMRGNYRGNYRGRFRGRVQNSRGYRGGSFNQRSSEYYNRQEANAVEDEVVLYAANVCNTVPEGKVTFILDSGASNHFVQEELEQYMHDVKTLPQNVSVYIANGEVLKTDKVGTLKASCQGQTVYIEALIVPKFDVSIKNDI